MNIAFFLKPKSEVAYLYDHYSVRQGLEKMCYHGYTAIPVIDKDGKYLGTVSEGDFLWHIVRGENTENNQVEIKNEEEFLVRNLMKKDINTSVSIISSMEEMITRAMDRNFIPVVDDRGLFIGIITRRDVIKYFYDKTKDKL